MPTPPALALSTAEGRGGGRAALGDWQERSNPEAVTTALTVTSPACCSLSPLHLLPIAPPALPSAPVKPRTRRNEFSKRRWAISPSTVKPLPPPSPPHPLHQAPFNKVCRGFQEKSGESPPTSSVYHPLPQGLSTKRIPPLPGGAARRRGEAPQCVPGSV